MIETLPIWAPILGCVLALACLLAAAQAGKRRRLIDNLPTCKTTGVFIGLVELKGAAVTSEPLTSCLAEQQCVYYKWSVEEHWSRTITESYTDSDGKMQTRTRHESGWKTIDHGEESVPFYLQDDCGYILIRPQGAKIEPLTIFDETCGTSDALYYDKGPPDAVADSDYRRRFQEQAFPHEANLYIL